MSPPIQPLSHFQMLLQILSMLEPLMPVKGPLSNIRKERAEAALAIQYSSPFISKTLPIEQSTSTMPPAKARERAFKRLAIQMAPPALLRKNGEKTAEGGLPSRIENSSPKSQRIDGSSSQIQDQLTDDPETKPVNREAVKIDFPSLLKMIEQTNQPALFAAALRQKFVIEPIVAEIKRTVERNSSPIPPKEQQLQIALPMKIKMLPHPEQPLARRQLKDHLIESSQKRIERVFVQSVPSTPHAPVEAVKAIPQPDSKAFLSISLPPSLISMPAAFVFRSHVQSELVPPEEEKGMPVAMPFSSIFHPDKRTTRDKKKKQDDDEDDQSEK